MTELLEVTHIFQDGDVRESEALFIPHNDISYIVGTRESRKSAGENSCIRIKLGCGPEGKLIYASETPQVLAARMRGAKGEEPKEKPPSEREEAVEISCKNCVWHSPNTCHFSGSLSCFDSKLSRYVNWKPIKGQSQGQ